MRTLGFAAPGLINIQNNQIIMFSSNTDSSYMGEKNENL